MSKELEDLQDLKSAFISHCKELGCDENYIKVCENKFNDIETALKRLEEINKYNVASGIEKYFDIIKYNLSEDVTSDLLEALEKVNNACLKLAMIEIMIGKDQLSLKKLQALEIIDRKNVDIVIFKSTNDFITYNKHRIPDEIKDYIHISDYMLIKEEFDLLKEVLSRYEKEN